MTSELYEIRIRHRVGSEMLHILGDLEPVLAGDCTILRTEGIDQAMLHGALSRVANLGLEIIAVERVHSADGTPQP